MSQSITNAAVSQPGQGLTGLRSGSEENERQAQSQHAAWLLQMEKALLAANPFSIEKEQEAPAEKRRGNGHHQEQVLQAMPGALVQQDVQPAPPPSATGEDGEINPATAAAATAATAGVDDGPQALAAKGQAANSAHAADAQGLNGSLNPLLNVDQTVLNAQPFWQNPQAATLLRETVLQASPAVQAVSPAAPARVQLSPLPGLSALPHPPAANGEVDMAYAEQVSRAGPKSEMEQSEPWPLRHLHVYPGQDGVQAWVRDASLNPLQVQVLLTQMQQQMQGQGMQLKSLTVNGVRVKAADGAGASAELDAEQRVEPGMQHAPHTSSAAETNAQGNALLVN